MIKEDKLYILLKLSKIWVLPFSVNINNNLTRISDLLFLGKTVITSNIYANENLEFLNYANSKEEFIYKINFFLEENRYNDKNKFEKIRNYYESNFNISLILDKIVEKYE